LIVPETENENPQSPMILQAKKNKRKPQTVQGKRSSIQTAHEKLKINSHLVQHISAMNYQSKENHEEFLVSSQNLGQNFY